MVLIMVMAAAAKGQPSSREDYTGIRQAVSSEGTDTEEEAS
jgi:hypothetical protein